LITRRSLWAQIAGRTVPMFMANINPCVKHLIAVSRT
jgi:hypothetical protein